jgi:hypothetical protein
VWARGLVQMAQHTSSTLVLSGCWGSRTNNEPSAISVVLRLEKVRLTDLTCQIPAPSSAQLTIMMLHYRSVSGVWASLVSCGVSPPSGFSPLIKS